MRPQRIKLPLNYQERLSFIAKLFPDNSGPFLSESWKGGRKEAFAKLASIDPVKYGQTRNFLDGKVTHLSPYLRHGCLTLSEAISAVKNKSLTGNEKLLFEFAWRDYWRRIWYEIGNKIYTDIEPSKVNLKRKDLPNDFIESQTRLECIDSFVRDLKLSGYIHNHARMWLASYIVHWLGIDWRQAARWMHDLLIDGDQASNYLSWQWVASTFSSKAYFFNKENLKKFSHNIYCQKCRSKCPFDDSYENLEARLFQPPRETIKLIEEKEIKLIPSKTGSNKIVLFHDEMLSSQHQLLNISERKLFIFDPELYKGWSINRLQFIADCLIELPSIEVWQGPTRLILEQLDCKKVITQRTPNLQLINLIYGYDIELIDEEKIYPEDVYLNLSKTNLRRFSKYWSIVSPFFTDEKTSLRDFDSQSNK